MESVSKKMVNIIFLIITISLFGMSLFVHCELNIYTYLQVRTIEHHRIHVYLILTLLSVIAVLFLYALTNRIMFKIKNPKMTVFAVVAGCALVIFAASIFWINFNDSLPKSDQATLYMEARKLAGYLQEPFNTEYMTYFKRQRGFTLLIAVVLRLFGESQIPMRLLNVIGDLALLVGIYKLVNHLVKDKSYIIFTSVTLTLFYPLVIYTSFMYGTILSLTSSVWGFYAVVTYCETEKKRYAVLAAISFSLGVLMHQSAAVAAVAGSIYLFVHINRLNALKHCLAVAAIVFSIFLSLQFMNIIYEKLTNSPAGDTIPATAAIYMGLNSEAEDGGPGSQDGSDAGIFVENNEDAAATNRDAINRIKSILSDYVTGKRSLLFFVRKTEYQWLDPTMGARKIIVLNDLNMGEPPNSENFIQFYNSVFRTIVYKITNIFMILIYGFAAAAGIFTMLKKNDTAEDKSVHFLIQLFFIGGFAFQLMWESLPRYCFPYFVCLIPEAIYGIHCLYQLIHNIKGKA